MKHSLEWLDNASKTEEYYVHSYLGGQRSEVREGRFNEHVIPEIIDSDVINKYNKALGLSAKKKNH